jgi:hypothetical protein
MTSYSALTPSPPTPSHLSATSPRIRNSQSLCTVQSGYMVQHNKSKLERAETNSVNVGPSVLLLHVVQLKYWH